MLISNMLITGTSQILLVAPNNSPHKVANLTGVISPAQPETGNLINSIASNSDASAIVVSEELDFDPNWNELDTNDVKKQIAQIYNTNNTKYLVEFHQLDQSPRVDICIYYPRGFHKSGRFAKEAKEILSVGRHLKDMNSQISNFPISKGEPISNFSARDLKQASIRIDVAPYLFTDPVLRTELEENLYILIAKM
jgi:hypothetical protein